MTENQQTERQLLLQRHTHAQSTMLTSTLLLVCSRTRGLVRGIGEERGLTFTFACLLALCHLSLLSRCATTAKGWHSPMGCRTQQVLSSHGVLLHCRGQPGFPAYYTAPPGAKVSDMQFGRRVDLCHTPSTSARSAQGRRSNVTDSTRSQPE